MKLLILDGNSVINRAYFGVKPLTTRDGLYTHAIYGFLNILERMEKEEQPEAVCVAARAELEPMGDAAMRSIPHQRAGARNDADLALEAFHPGFSHSNR